MEFRMDTERDGSSNDGCVPGFIYVLSNEAMPGLVKIGLTTKTPMERAAQLFSTAVPVPFKVEFAIYTPDVTESEERIHEQLDHHRVSDAREFFRVEPSEAAILLMQSFLSMHNYSIVYDEFVIPERDIVRYSNMSNTHSVDILNVLPLIPPYAWQAAGDSHREIVAIRRAELNRGERFPLTGFTLPETREEVVAELESLLELKE
jgi:hypothetical protein